MSFVHYFKDIEHKDDDFFVFEEEFLDEKVRLKSCNNVFSKNEIDYGTKVLIKTIFENYDLNFKNCLDLGCGLGIVAIMLSKKFEKSNFVLSDVTIISCKLSKENLKQNGCEDFEVKKSDLFENINQKFDFVITNPPIRAGKQLLLKLITDSVNFLNENGRLVLVIRKNHGEESVKKFMETKFSSVCVLKRDKGFYVLEGVK
ncbi:MAG: class I SAM-dependent methyltransferase [Christensenellales bacterium]